MKQFVIMVIVTLFFSGRGLNGWAQSGFSLLHGDSAGISYTCGQLFYRQYNIDISVNEGVEQSYLLRDTVRDEGCEGIAYDNFGIIYGDTLAAGLYLSRQYRRAARDGYDSVFVHLLTVYPNVVVYDTLLLEEGDLGSYIVGQSVDSLHSSHGCDSVIFRMVYAVSCPSDYLVTAPYGVAEMPFSTVEPSVTPSSDGISISSDVPPLLTVGTPVQVSWLLVAGQDTFRCVQNLLVEYPPCGDGFMAVDGDGNVYETVRIGADCWMKGNVYARHYAGTGAEIPVADVFATGFFPDTVSNLQNYGRLYSWYSAVGIPENSTELPSSNMEGEVQGVCPVGWHIPTSAELSALQGYEGADLKAIGNLWFGEAPSDASHFSIVPAGKYNAALNRYEDLRTSAYLWLSDTNVQTAASSAYIRYICSELDITCLDKTDRCSVRCAKD